MTKTRKIIFMVLFIGILFIATLFDINISEYLYNPNSSFGCFFESFGEVIIAYIGCFSSMFYIVSTTKKVWYKRIGFYLLFLFNLFTATTLLVVHLKMDILWGMAPIYIVLFFSEKNSFICL